MLSYLELKGVLHGKTITLDEATFLPDGCPVIVRLTLSKEEALRQLALPCPDLTPEEVADLEECLSEFHERPIKLPPPENR
ncbi:MAG TPA: hypothetical protein VN688_30415 [Gemmataceae bacterium]|nr:hypothetical protein [Gemmataceae bacterium]